MMLALFALVATLSSVHALVDKSLQFNRTALVRQRLIESAKASWELGTAAQALLEYDNPAVGVFGPKPFPPPVISLSNPVIGAAGRIVDSKAPNLKALMEDGAAADPFSNIISVILANLSHPETTKYSDAIDQQFDYLLNDVPKGENGVISHRVEELQLWSDFCSMVPPQLAYYGAVQPGTDAEYKYLKMAYDQLKMYRDVLRDPETGLWRHIMYGSWDDQGRWATGQGWAAHGMIRVHQTLHKSSISDRFTQEKADLVEWAKEIMVATWAEASEDGSLTNYLDDAKRAQGGDFREMASTAFMAAITYRLTMLTDVTDWIPAADKAFALVQQKVDEDGWLVDVVNPHTFSAPGEHSPEGQAFVLMLQAAYRDYQAASHGINSVFGSLTNLFTSAAKLKATKEAKVSRRHWARRGMAEKYH